MHKILVIPGLRAGLVLVCSDERKCEVMKGCAVMN